MELDFENIFVPTKFSPNKKLSSDIFNWYLQNVPGCTSIGIKESLSAEEAMALNVSIVEHNGLKGIGQDMVSLMKEVHVRINDSLKEIESIEKSRRIQSANHFNFNGMR